MHKIDTIYSHCNSLMVRTFFRLCVFSFFFHLNYNVFKVPDGPGVKVMPFAVDIILENVYKCHYK